MNRTCARSLTLLAAPFLASLFFGFGCASIPKWAPPPTPTFELFMEEEDNTCDAPLHPVFSDDHGALCVQAAGLRGPAAHTDPKGKLLAIGREDDFDYWTIFYENGAPRAAGNLVEGQRDGEWTFYAPEGHVRATGNYEFGAPSWDWEFYYPDGSLSIQGAYTEAYDGCEGLYAPGMREGIWTWFHPNGARAMVVAFIDDLPSGPFYSFHDNEAPEFKGHYTHGAPSGVWERFDKKGLLVEEINFDYRGAVLGEIKNGLREGLWTSYDLHGIAREQGEYVQGRRHGPWVFRDEKGALLAEGIYVTTEDPPPPVEDNNLSLDHDDLYDLTEEESHLAVLHGPWRAYHPNGELQRSGTYHEGLKDGTWSFWREDGSLLREGEMVQGLAEGTWTLFDPQGATLATYEMSGGSGEVPVFDASGRQVETCEMENHRKEGYCVGDTPDGGRYEREYHNDLPDGLWAEYDTDGEILSECYYWNEEMDCREGGYLEDGRLLEEDFYPDGTLKSRGYTYDEGYGDVYDGEWSAYHPKGTIATSGTYEWGARTGLWITTSPQGHTTSEGEFEYDERNGIWTFSDDNGELIARGNMADGRPSGDWRVRQDGVVVDMHFEDGWTGPKQEELWEGQWRRYEIKEESSDAGPRFSLVPAEEVFYLADKRQGDYRLEEYGRILTGQYQLDEKEGTWTETKNGVKIRESVYQMGVEISETHWSDEGTLLWSREEGVFRHFFPSGQLHAEDRSEEEGTATYYWPNGQLRARGNLDHWPSTEWELWSLDGTPITLPTSPEGVDYPWGP